MDSDRFDSFLAQVASVASQERIRSALLAARIENVTFLKQVVEGHVRVGRDALEFLQRTLSLNEFDAPVLAGLLLEPQAQIQQPAVDYKEIFEQMKAVLTDAINTTLNERESSKKEKTIVISSATEGQVKNLLKRAGLVQKVATPPPLIIDGCLPFDWRNAMKVQRTPEACSHLEILLQQAVPNFKTDFQLLDTHALRSVLNFEDSKIGKISGGTDLVITPNGTAVGSLHDEICVLFELKTSSQMNSNFENPAIVELISASFLSEQPSILCLLTDLNSVTEAWRTYYDQSLDQNVVDRYYKLTLDQTISLIAFHLTQVVRNPVFFAKPSSNDPNAQRALCQKRKLDTSGLQEALDRFEDMAEGTADWSRDRALATWNLLQNMGVEQMPTVVKYSMMNT